MKFKGDVISCLSDRHGKRYIYAAPRSDMAGYFLCFEVKKIDGSWIDIGAKALTIPAETTEHAGSIYNCETL